ncbi:MAG: Gfo/Idh/MocA family oxidoreductase [Planctomycetaceae bacterium]|nr:Gfo/Idh/MocA family oxidoreductase [Planctomycetaceae bacterium]
MSVRIAVVGCGRMGKLHARVISETPEAVLACVVDSNAAAANALGKQRNCPALTDAAEAVKIADAAIIAVPTSAHLAAARPFLEAGKSVLIEKPLALDPAEGEEMIALAKKSGAKMQVGHTERFNPAVVAMRKHTIKPKFIEAHRISPFTFRSADVGVVLDMMIHDIDLVLMVAGTDEVDTVHAVGVNVIGAHEDICNARLIFANGCVANITASRLAIKTERKMRIFSEEAYLSVDYAKKVGIVIEKSKNLDLIQMARDLDVEDVAELAQQVDYTKLLTVEELVVDDSTEPLASQAKSFCRTVAGQAPPQVSAEEGLAAIRVAKRIVESIKSYKWDGPNSQRQGLDIIRKD